MAIIYDSLGNEQKLLDIIGGETRTDPRPITQSISAVNGEVLADCFGVGSCAIDVRGTFSATLQVEASVNGVDYFSIPVMVPTSEIFQVNITTAGVYITHLPAATRRIRIRASAYTSGSATIAMRLSGSENFVYAKPIPATLAATATGASGAAVTLTISAAGAGLFHYITRIIVQRFAVAALTAGATPVLVTTTNLPGTRVLSFPADAALQGTIYSEVIEPTQPLKASAANTNTTIVCPATTSVIWRVTADYYAGA